MKRILLNLELLLVASIVFVACGTQETSTDINDTNIVNEQSEGNDSDISNEDSVTTSDIDSDDSEEIEAGEESEDMSLEENDDFGESIVWCGTLQSSMKDQSGQPGEYGIIQAIIYDGGLEGDTFTLIGTLNFKNDPMQDPIGMVPNDVNTFKVDANTKFQLCGGEGDPEDLTKEEFAKYFKDCLDTGLYFEAVIENGIATTVQICS